MAPWIARVDNHPITVADHEAEVARALARYQRNHTPVPPAVEETLRAHLLERMIDDELLSQHASAMGLRIEDRALDEAIAEQKARFHRQASYAEHVKNIHGGEAEARAALRRRMLAEQVVARLGASLGASSDTPSHGAVVAALRSSVSIERRGGTKGPVASQMSDAGARVNQ